MSLGDERAVVAGRALRPLTARRWAVASIASVFVLVSAYVLAVLTPAGQALENAALRGADQVREDEVAQASQALGSITVVSLAMAVILVAGVGLLRRRVDLAVAGVAVITLGQIITQGLKRFVLPRPGLVEVTGDYTTNSFPSGHTTIAMTVLFALVIVAPYRWRGLTLLLTLSWAIGIGAYTVTAKWHRFSDTLGADAVALLCACLAAWWLTRRGALRPYTGPARRARAVLAGLLAAAAVLLLALGLFLWVVPGLQGVDHSVPNETTDFTTYLGAHTLAAGCSAATALVYWVLWRRVEAAGGRADDRAQAPEKASR